MVAGRIKERRARLRLFTEADRIISINFDESERYQLEVQFQCTMSTTRQTNRAQIVVRGLNEQTRNDIAGIITGTTDVKNEFITLPGQDPPFVAGTDLFPSGSFKTETVRNGHAFVELDLGYTQAMSRAFEGSSHWARHRVEGPVWATAIDVGDGLSTRLGAYIARAFDPGASTFDVVSFIVRSMGLGPGNLTRDNFLAAVGANVRSNLPDGYTVDGDAVAMLDILLSGGNAEWWVDRGEFWIRPIGEPLPGVPLDISPENGLRYDPEPIEGGGVILNSWLRTDARIGRKAIVSARVLSGEYRLEQVTHRGSNLRGDYQTLMLARKLGPIPGLF